MLTVERYRLSECAPGGAPTAMLSVVCACAARSHLPPASLTGPPREPIPPPGRAAEPRPLDERARYGQPLDHIGGAALDDRPGYALRDLFSIGRAP
jgi:hypothetical protein